MTSDKTMSNPSERIIGRRALACRVLAVAVSRPFDGDDAWTAYIDAVPGRNHADESRTVADYGNKLPEATARTIFNGLAGPYIT